MNALATDSSINIQNYDIPENIEQLDLNDIDAVIEWILKNAKKV